MLSTVGTATRAQLFSWDHT